MVGGEGARAVAARAAAEEVVMSVVSVGLEAATPVVTEGAAATAAPPSPPPPSQPPPSPPAPLTPAVAWATAWAVAALVGAAWAVVRVPPPPG